MSSRRDPFGAPKAVHPHAWLWEPLVADPGFQLRRMFGGQSIYLDGRLMLHFAARSEPWRGVLVCTEREQQPALRADFPVLSPHVVLPKWLYLPESEEAFERVATALVKLVRRRDPRIGVWPPQKKKRRARPHGLSGHP